MKLYIYESSHGWTSMVFAEDRETALKLLDDEKLLNKAIEYLRMF